ncbi:MAG: hypothetical protein JNK78_14985 [Planctomycetes bacterium]|nr:hypothetical protein [Planctomycetota bacterium]
MIPPQHLLAGLCSLVLSVSVVAQRKGGPIRPGPWQTASKVPQGWVVHNTKNYHVQSEAGIEKAKRLGEHMEIMNAVYRRMFPPDKGGAKAQTIKLFKDEDSYQAYGAPAGAAAYYSSGDREMVCYDTGKWMDEAKTDAPVTGRKETPLERIQRRMKNMADAWKMDLLGCAAHEGWHQYFHWYVGSPVSLPSWINEGMGDYFYTAAPKDRDKGAKKAQVSLGNIFDGRLTILQEAKRQSAMEPIEKFLHMDQTAYYSNPSICYAQGWALCQFLLHGADGKYSKIVPTYLRLVRDDTNTDVVTQRAFKGIDLATLETEFKAWLDEQKASPDMTGGLDEPEEPETPVEPAPPAGGDKPTNGARAK